MKYTKGTFNTCSVKEIIDNKKPIIKHKKGVYFLIKNNEIVYVGQTIVELNRITTHVNDNTKDFDSYSFIEIDDYWERSVMEGIYIYTLKPKYNSRIVLEKRVRSEVLEILSDRVVI